jgi:hypothetical protein
MVLISNVRILLSLQVWRRSRSFLPVLQIITRKKKRKKKLYCSIFCILLVSGVARQGRL